MHAVTSALANLSPSPATPARPRLFDFSLPCWATIGSSLRITMLAAIGASASLLAGAAPAHAQTGTVSDPFTNMAQAHLAPTSGRYYFLVDGQTFQADVDTSEGGGWVLVLQYVHKSGTNPNLNIVSGAQQFPLLSTSALGADDSTDLSKWGHVGNSAMSRFLGNIETRFYSESSANTRIIHFKTTSGQDYIRTGTGSFAGVDTNHTTLTGHTGHLPAVGTLHWSDQGDEALTTFPFLGKVGGVGSNYHWSIKALGNRWEADDLGSGSTLDTIHRAWVRTPELIDYGSSSASCPYVANFDTDTPGYDSTPYYQFGSGGDNGQHLSSIGAITSDASGSGQFLYHFTGGTTNQSSGEAWGTTNAPTVLPNTYYWLRFKVANSSNTNKPIFQPQINGTSVGSTYTNPNVGSWDEHSVLWYSGSATSADISLIQARVTNTGVDWGFDDITLCNAEVDRSDAPAAYSIAAHEIDTDYKMGATIDIDTSSIANADASGDGADDDGVTLPVLTDTGSRNATVTVTQPSASAGYLQGWVDFNGDGDFTDAGEQVATDLQLTSGTTGTITVPITAPTGVMTGDSFARFRWSSTSGLDSSTAASDGEVEDYQIEYSEAYGSSSASCPYIMDFDGDTPIYDSTPYYQFGSGEDNGLHVASILAITSDASGSGKFLYHNTAGALPIGEAWGTVIPPTVLPNTYYRLSFKMANNNNVRPQTIQPQINGVNVGSTHSTTTVNIWEEASVLWYSGSATSADISLLQQTPSGAGVDWGFDDITLCNAEVDRSDAPTAYSTASHVVDVDYKMGAAIDIDASPIANADASGDGADDDGVTLPVLTDTGSRDATITVTQPSASAGYLQGWVDFNGDGDFTDAGEQVATDLQLTSGTTGTITVPITAPTGVMTGDSFARFRWSSTSGLDSSTAASDGEVEDYQIEYSEAYGSSSASCPYIMDFDGDTPIYDSTAYYQFGSGNDNGQHLSSFGTITSDASGSGQFLYHATGGTTNQSNGEAWGTANAPTVLPNTYYRLSFKMANSSSTNTAHVTPQINGVDVGSNSIAPGTGVWTEFSTLWYSGSATSADISLIQARSTNNGVEWGFDDITLCNAEVDRSDAPAAYSTASHVVDVDYKMGAAIDIDTSSIANADASGDGVDDDGVTIPALTQGESESITVNVTQAAASDGYLQGWIDFNGDNDFTDAGEQIATDLQYSAGTTGTITVPVSVPANAISTAATFARFRWSTTSGLDSTAAASNGEVEDYSFTINTSNAPAIIGTAPFCATPTVLDLSRIESSSPNHSNFDAGPVGVATQQLSDSGSNNTPDGFVGGNIYMAGSQTTNDEMEYTFSEPVQVVISQSDQSTGVWFDAGETHQFTVDGATFSLTDAGSEHIRVGGSPGDPRPELTLNSGNNSSSISITPRTPAGQIPKPDSNWMLVSTLTTKLTHRLDVTSSLNQSQVNIAVCTVPVEYDHSDAPANGSTAPDGSATTSYGDAEHTIVSGIQLGAAIDGDTSSIANADASGDGADDDGVTIPALTQGESESITVNVTQAAASEGYLQGWIDFNGDGDFADAGEQIATNLQYSAGTTGAITVPVSVPANAISTAATFARFRWSTTSGLDSTAAVSDGEVEDYSFTIIARAPSLAIQKDAPTNADEDSSSSVSLGDTLTYTITATNDGNVTLTGVEVSDAKITPNSVTCASLAPAATCVLTGTYSVTQTDVDAGSVNNTATVTSPDVTGTITSPEVVTPTGQNPSLAIQKDAPTNADEDSSSSVSLGDTLTYTITATNDGNVTLTGVEVSDAKITPNSVTCASLAPAATCVLTGTYSVTQTDVDAGSVNNTATVTSPDVTGTITSPEVVTPTGQNPSLAIQKDAPTNADEDSSSSVSLGDTLTYTITATNDGNVTLTGVEVSDAKITPNSVTCASLAPAATCVLTGTYSVTQTDVDAGSVNNTATVTSPDVTGTITSPEVVTPTGQNPSLAIQKDAPTNADEDSSSSVSLGDTLTYTITATNDGNVTLTGVEVSDAKITPNSVTCASLAPAATCVLTGTYSVTQTDVDAGSVNNTATVTSPDVTGTITSPEVVTPTGQNPSLAIQKDAPTNADEDSSSSVSLGDTLTYTITATNDGNVTLTGVEVSDAKITPNSVTCASLAPAATCVLTGTYSVTQTDVDAGSVNNTATVTSPDVTGTITSPEVVTPTGQNPSLAIQKDAPTNADEDSSSSVSLGDTLTYTITATNDGNVTLTGVEVSDAKITPNSVTCASLAPAATCVLTGTYSVTQTDVDAGSVNNTATVTSPDVTGTITSPEVVTPTGQNPSLAIQKDAPTNADEDSSSSVSLGDTLTYTITATNDGNVTLTGVEVSDAKITPNSVTCASLAPAATCVLTGTYSVTQTDVDAGSVNNTATVTSPDVTGTITSPEVVTPTGQNPSLAIQKDAPTNADEDSSSSVSLGDTLTYTITATNDGNVTLTGVEVSDAKITPNSVTCASLAPAATCVLTGTYSVTQTDVDAGSVNNTATVTSPDVTGTITSPEVVTPTVEQEPSLAIEQGTPVNADEDGSGTITVGDTLTYVATATNDGNTTLTDVTVSNPNFTPGSITCPSVAPGESCVLTGTYTVTQEDVDAGGVNNSGTTTSSPDVTGSVTAPNEVTTPTVEQEPSLAIEQGTPVNADEDGSGTITVGDTLTYVATATNDGNTTLTDVTVSNPNFTPGSITCPSVAPGESCVLTGTYTVTQEDVDAGGVNNSGTTTSSPDVTGSVTAPNEVTTPTVEQEPSLAIEQGTPVNADEDGSGTITVGDTLTYVATATNDGNTTLTDVTVSNPNFTPGSITCPSVAPGESCVLTGTYTVTQEDVDAGGVNNSGTTTSSPDVTGSVTPPNEVTTPTVEQEPSLAIEQGTPVNADEDGSGTITVGDTLTYVATATNDGNTTLTDVTVSNPNFTPGSITCPSVAPGESCVLTGTYTVTQEDVDAGGVNNSGTTTSSPDVTGSVTPPNEVTTPTAEPTTTLSGTINIGSGGNSGSGTGEETLEGWIVELVVDGVVIATTVTDENGGYSFDGVAPGSGYSVQFRDPVTGVIFGVITDITLEVGAPTTAPSMAIDPSGVIYDAVTREPVAGAVATLVDSNGTPLPELCFVDPSQQRQTTGGTGNYRFDIVTGAAAQCPTNETAYRIAVTPPAGYSFVSTILLPQSEALNPTGQSNPVRVSDGMTAPTAANPVYYLEFLLDAGDPDVINNHIPLDPFLSRNNLVVTKTSTRRSASTGDLVPYQITVRNTENAQRAGVDVVDILPAGMKYVAETARVNGVASEPETANSGRELVWPNLTVPAGGSVQIDLTMVVGAGVATGERVNTALAERGVDGTDISNRGTATISVVPSAVFDCSELLGKVFEDINRNGYQDEGEPGVPGVRLATVNGQLITTDEYGRYHIACAAVPDSRIGSNFILKLDMRTVPLGWEATTGNPQSIRLTRGKFGELNFGVAPQEIEAARRTSRGRE